MKNLFNYVKRIQKSESISQHSIVGIETLKDPKNKPLKIKKVKEGKEHIKRIMIDFDGVLHDYSGWNNGVIDGKPIEGSKEAMEKLGSIYDEVIIFTTRASEEQAAENNDNLKKRIKDVQDWLQKYEIPYTRITGSKLAADFYIDDKAITFKGNWPLIISKIMIKEDN